jgi:hypothetical protein
VSDLDRLERDLQRAVRDVVDEVRQVVSRGALNVKRDWRRRWSGHPTIRHLPDAVGYDVHGVGNTISAEIGPDKNRRQGPLGNIIEFGSVNNPPIPGGLPALRAEAPRFERALTDVAERLLR